MSGLDHFRLQTWEDKSSYRFFGAAVSEMTCFIKKKKLEMIVSPRLGPNPIRVDIAEKSLPLVL